MLVRLKAGGGTGGWIVELKDYAMSAVFIEKTTPEPGDRTELDEALEDGPFAGHVDREKLHPYVEISVGGKQISQLRSQAGWR